MRLSKFAVRMAGCALLISAAATYCGAQEKKSPPAAGEEISASSSAKTLTVVGKVNSEGTALLTDIDSEWSVSNPEMLKGYEGQLVKVRCYVDTARTRLHILLLRREQTEQKLAAHRQDSAFRR